MVVSINKTAVIVSYAFNLVVSSNSNVRNFFGLVWKIFVIFQTMVSDRRVLPYKSVVLTNHAAVSLMEIVKEFLCREKGAPNRREESLNREVESVTHATSRAVFRFNDEDRDDWSRPSVAMQKQQRTFQVTFAFCHQVKIHCTSQRCQLVPVLIVVLSTWTGI